MEKIDSLDRQILEIISQNARIPFKDVAAECGVSRAAILQRVQRLIDLGVIIGSGYHVNPKSLGYRTCTYVGIKLEKGSMYKAVVNELKKIPEGGLLGILYYKLLMTDKYNINTRLEIFDSFKAKKYNSLDDEIKNKVCKLIGIFLDNEKINCFISSLFEVTVHRTNFRHNR